MWRLVREVVLEDRLRRDPNYKMEGRAFSTELSSETKIDRALRRATRAGVPPPTYTEHFVECVGAEALPPFVTDDDVSRLYLAARILGVGRYAAAWAYADGSALPAATVRGVDAYLRRFPVPSGAEWHELCASVVHYMSPDRTHIGGFTPKRTHYFIRMLWRSLAGLGLSESEAKKRALFLHATATSAVPKVRAHMRELVEGTLFDSEACTSHLVEMAVKCCYMVTPAATDADADMRLMLLSMETPRAAAERKAAARRGIEL